ncbi:MgtC/SapB family protein [Solimonas marina]|uniref:Protein MgtC n=1 Tax=Solimonas marina TaxID=2714601 RepID=A0A970B7X3_9GAMM|nr:MgtC/SapB family protein [Solimonas marina]NKF20856.1 MgtC/SapB family protein [Solimonas marina]
MSFEMELVLRLLLAALLGSLIGFERERLSWAAGLRTHMLVCVGSALIMIVSAHGFEEVRNADHVSYDPSRMASLVVSGIGFLGAGSILLRGEVIRGLTTAASLWATAALGLAAGAGMYVEAAAATLIVLFILAVLKPLERRIFQPQRHHQLRLHVAHDALSYDDLRGLLGQHTARIKQFVVRQSPESSGDDQVTIVLGRLNEVDYAQILAALVRHPGVRDVKEGDL